MGSGDIGALFAATLEQIGSKLTPEDLLDLYPPHPSDIKGSEGDTSIVLEECKYFDLFDADPRKVHEEAERLQADARKAHGASFVQQILMSTKHHPLKMKRTMDYRLESREKAKLAVNGVVVPQRLQAKSFAEIYYQLYTDDMPVFVTADSILHAWHRSFDSFLVELEIKILGPTLDKILVTTLSTCQDFAARAAASASPSIKAAIDVELFLSVALSLLRGKDQDSLPQTSAKMEQLWLAIQEEAVTTVEILSAERLVDFSLFIPRGHYTKSEVLKRYFRAMVWIGTIDFQIAGGKDLAEDLYQLRCAVLLVHFLQEAQSLAVVTSIDSVISSLVADGGFGADSLSPSQLAQLLYQQDKNILKAITSNLKATNTAGPSEELLLDLQKQIVEKGLGEQLINGQPRVEDLPLTATVPSKLPTSFALLG